MTISNRNSKASPKPLPVLHVRYSSSFEKRVELHVMEDVSRSKEVVGAGAGGCDIAVVVVGRR